MSINKDFNPIDYAAQTRELSEKLAETINDFRIDYKGDPEYRANMEFAIMASAIAHCTVALVDAKVIGKDSQLDAAKTIFGDVINIMVNRKEIVL